MYRRLIKFLIFFSILFFLLNQSVMANPGFLIGENENQSYIPEGKSDFDLGSNTISPSQASPMLIAPSNETVVSGSTIQFRWQGVPGADRYFLSVARISDNKSIFYDYVGTATSYNVTGFKNDNTEYHWAVWAGGDGWLTKSPTWVFKNGQSKSFKAAPTISAGSSHSLALKRDGTVWAWGWNGSEGRLGDGTTAAKHSPVQVSGLSNVIEISAGGAHSLALKSDGTVWAWGSNSYGQLGDDSNINRRTPVQVSGLSNVVKISAGGTHSLALRSDGSVWAWGNNSSGRLGDGTRTRRLTPVRVSNLSGVVEISAGGSHSLALEGSNGTVWAWGANSFKGQLGDGTAIDRDRPVQVINLSFVTGISAGGYHSLAVKSDGTVWAWGCTNWGKLGDGKTGRPRQLAPVKTMTINDALGVYAGAIHSLALRSNLTVWAWGRNASGQLGTGTTSDAHAPVQTKNLTNIHQVSAGSSHSLALGSDGSVWAWGYNNNGRLGDGTTTNRRTPVKIPNFNLEKTTPAIIFSDVSPTMQFYPYIQTIASANITTGYPDGTFRPNDPVTRGQMAAFLYRALNLSFTGNVSPSFIDVPVTMQFFPYIETIYAEGITTGYNDGTYRPNYYVTRGQMAMFIDRAFFGGWYFPYIGPQIFSDVHHNMQAYYAIRNLYNAEIVTGYPDNTFRPNDPVTRGQMAAFISRALELTN